MKLIWMFSVTSTEPLGDTMISASNFSIRSSLLTKEDELDAKNSASVVAIALRSSSHFKELALLEAEHVGKNVGRKLFDFGVEVAHHGVVIPARVLHRVLDLRKGVLQRSKTLDGAKLRISFGKREEAFQRAGKHIFGLGFLSGRRGGHRAVARVDDAFQRILLVRGI